MVYMLVLLGEARQLVSQMEGRGSMLSRPLSTPLKVPLAPRLMSVTNAWTPVEQGNNRMRFQKSIGPSAYHKTMKCTTIETHAASRLLHAVRRSSVFSQQVWGIWITVFRGYPVRFREIHRFMGDVDNRVLFALGAVPKGFLVGI